MKEHGWKVKSSEANRIYFSCAKCTVRFGSKAQTDDVESGEWVAVNMPPSHDCFKTAYRPVATAVTTRVCNLPNEVFNEIQRLACCKAFLTVSIQTFIKHRFGIVVDTALIYNIGYRARQRLGIGDIERLYEQQKVTVYTLHTSPSFTLT
jgi:hypothetical protein